MHAHTHTHTQQGERERDRERERERERRRNNEIRMLERRARLDVCVWGVVGDMRGAHTHMHTHTHTAWRRGSSSERSENKKESEGR